MLLVPKAAVRLDSSEATHVVAHYDTEISFRAVTIIPDGESLDRG